MKGLGGVHICHAPSEASRRIWSHFVKGAKGHKWAKYGTIQNMKTS